MTNTEYRELIADTILLPGESREFLFQRMDDLEDAFQPRSRREQTMIEEMSTNFWHNIRISTIERVIFGWQMEEQARRCCAKLSPRERHERPVKLDVTARKHRTAAVVHL